VILAAISGASSRAFRVAPICNRRRSRKGFRSINPSTGEFAAEFRPLASAEVILLDEISRIPLKSQARFSKASGSHGHVGKTTYDCQPSTSRSRR
jgi:hypothetical protein